MSNPNSFPGIGRTVVRWLGEFFATEPDPAKEKFLSKMASSSLPRPEEFEALLTLLHKGAVEIQCQSCYREENGLVRVSVIGNSTTKVAPCPCGSALSAQILPPCASTNALAIANPSPDSPSLPKRDGSPR